jgi:hypothetical protein
MRSFNESSQQHIGFIVDLIREIDQWPAELVAFEYQSEVFGSWSLVVRRKGTSTQFTYDGKEHLLHADKRRSDSGAFPPQPHEIGSIEVRSPFTGLTFAKLVQFIRECAG